MALVVSNVLICPAVVVFIVFCVTLVACSDIILDAFAATSAWSVSISEISISCKPVNPATLFFIVSIWYCTVSVVLISDNVSNCSSVIAPEPI